MGSEHDKYAGQVFVWAGTGNPKDVGEVVAKMRDRIAALEAALNVLATELYGKALDRAVGQHWDAEINDAVWANPIAAAAVREAGR